MSENARFSIQKHDAVDFHYVLRFESPTGATMSFAVPKGPSPDPRVKRLAIPIEDDGDLDFEGTLDADGERRRVIVWDSGAYQLADLDGEPMTLSDGLACGKLEFWLQGKKLQGGFTLLRIEEGNNERWLLIKKSDDKATSRRDPVNTEPLSVLTGRPIEDIDG